MTNIFLISTLVYLIYILVKSQNSFHMLQQNKYNNQMAYLKWINNNKKAQFIDASLLFIFFILLIPFNTKVTMTVFIFFFCLLTLNLISKRKKAQNKLPLKYTSRIKRLFVTDMIIYILPILIISIYVNKENLVYCYLLLGLMAYLNNIYILLAVLINSPIEALVNLYYKQKAINKLKSMNNMKVIGITGSYGKTSSKNILNDILNIKYNALKTPKNYNTPGGLMITINNYLDKFSDIFIAEMGAYKEGEIKELCDLVHPKYGILTKIGIAHLESFGSREIIQKTKFELIESLPHDGIGVLNADDEYQRNYKLKNNCKIIWIGIDSKDADVVAQDITITKDGTKFNIVFKGDKNKYPFETKLLGYANVYNILAAVALGKEFNMSIEQLKAGVRKVKAVEHRLELKRKNDIVFIDDAYNSNPTGAKMALDVLKLMPGKHIVVTPGMIELGKEEYQKNKEFGKQIADSADEVILVGENKTKPIKEGLEEKQFNLKKIHVINDVLEAFPLVEKLKQKETYVLLENDLPDIFNEQ